MVRETLSRPRPTTGQIEQRESQPKVDVEFFFSPHQYAEDFKRARELFDQADVVVPEAWNWDDDTLNYIQGISAGERKPMLSPSTADQAKLALKKMVGWLLSRQRGQDLRPFQAEADALFYNSHKLVMLVDVPKANPISQDIKSLYEKRKKDGYAGFQAFTSGSPDEAIALERSSINHRIKAAQLRNNFIQSNLRERLAKLPEEFPELKQRQHIKVLVCLGSAHTPVHRALQDEHSAKRSFGQSLTVYSPAHEAERRFAANLPIDDKLVMHAVMYDVMSFLVLDDLSLKVDTERFERIARRLSASFSMEEAQELSTQLAAAGNALDDKGAIILRALEAKGIIVPRNIKEVDEMLNTRGSKDRLK